MKFTLKTFFNVIAVIGVITWSICFFFGFNFAMSGSLIASIPVAVFVLLAMGFLVWQMKRKSNPDFNDHAANAKTTEYTCLGIYGVISLISAFYILHMITVTTSVQNDIQDKARAEMDELNRVFGDAETSGSYLNYVADRSSTYRMSLKAQDLDESTISVKQKSFEENLIIRSGFQELQSEVHNFLSRCDYSISNFVYLTVGKYVSQLEQNKAAWEAKVEEYSDNNDITAADPYRVNAKYEASGLSKKITAPNFGEMNFGLGLIVIIILQFLILLTYYVGKPKNDHFGKVNNLHIRSYRRND